MGCEALLMLPASPLSSHSGLLPQGFGKCCFLDLKCYALTQPSKALSSYPLLSLSYFGISLMSPPQRFPLTSIEVCELSLQAIITSYHMFVWSLRIIFVSLPQMASPTRVATMPASLLVLLEQRALCQGHRRCLKIFVKLSDLPKGIDWAF